MNPSRFVVAVIAGFAAMFVTNAIAAFAVIDPVLGDDYPEITGTDTQFDWPLLLGGYILIAATIGWLHQQSRDHSNHWLRHGLTLGVPIGLATFAGVHLVQTGYTTINNTAWILSGLLDIFGPIICSVIIAALATNTPPPKPSDRINTVLGHLADKPDRLRHNIAELEAVSRTVDQHLIQLRRQAGTTAK